MVFGYYDLRSLDESPWCLPQGKTELGAAARQHGHYVQSQPELWRVDVGAYLQADSLPKQ